LDHRLRFQTALALRSRGARHFYFTNRTLTGGRILRLSNGTMVGLTADKSRSSRRVLTLKRFRTTKCPTVTTDPIVPSALLAKLTLRKLPCGNWAALASSSQPAIEPVCYLGLALSSASARDIERGQDFLFCAPNPNGIRPELSGDDEEGTWVKHDPVFKEREQERGLLRSQERLRSRSAVCRGVAVTVAVRCSTSATFQAFASDPLCAQDFCKLLVKCGFPKDGCDEHG
jgi:hypothetical protein